MKRRRCIRTCPKYPSTFVISDASANHIRTIICDPPITINYHSIVCRTPAAGVEISSLLKCRKIPYIYVYGIHLLYNIVGPKWFFCIVRDRINTVRCVHPVQRVILEYSIEHKQMFVYWQSLSIRTMRFEYYTAVRCRFFLFTRMRCIVHSFWRQKLTKI